MTEQNQNIPLRFPIKADTKEFAYLLPNRGAGSIPWEDAIPVLERWYPRYQSAGDTFKSRIQKLAEQGGLDQRTMDAFAKQYRDSMSCKVLPMLNWKKNFIAESVAVNLPETFSPKSFSEYLLYATVRIETSGIDPHTSDRTKGAATGFLFDLDESSDDESVLVVTNKHIFKDATSVTFCFPRAKEVNGRKVPSSFLFEYPLQNWNSDRVDHPNEDIDLCAFRMKPIIEAASENGKPIFLAPLFPSMVPSVNDLNLMPVIQEVFMYGYPIGLWDKFNGLPIVRRGSLASHPALDFSGEPVGAVDIAAFPGSSGSPVLVVSDGGPLSDKNGNVWSNRPVAVFMGVLSKRARMNSDGTIDMAAIPVQHQIIEDHGMIPIHLGYYIKSTEVCVLSDTVKGLSAASR